MNTFNTQNESKLTSEKRPKSSSEKVQYSTFIIAGRLYGIDVTKVQEVVRPMPITPVPLAPPYISGLINLRGQVATAIGLRQLFELPSRPSEELMNVVCKAHGALLSFQVDEIGDVVEVEKSEFEETPAIIHESIKRFLGGIYKVNSTLLSVLEIDPIGRFLGLITARANEAS
jgi:purine-binding chemotaxis protein CheW